MQYPFEPKFSSVERLRSLGDFDQKFDAFDALEGASAPQQASLEHVAGFVAEYGLISKYNEDGEFVYHTKAVKEEIMKFYFGIGRRAYAPQSMYNTRGETPELWNGVGIFLPIFGSDIILSGFKYGLINANPQKSRAIFRADRFGQFRDMLEQRPWSRFFSEADGSGPSEVPVRVRFVQRKNKELPVDDPEDTNAQNLSVFATSSLPYFDLDRNSLGRMRATLPPDLEPPVDIASSIIEEVQQVIDGINNP